MPEFSVKSKERLLSCDSDLQKIFNEVIRHFDCVVICGYRSKEEQDEAYRTGKSKLQWPDGKHNTKPSLAVDVAPCINSKIDWNDRQTFYYFGGFVLGVASQMGIKLRYGGDWNGNNDLKDQTFFDLPHFELVR